MDEETKTILREMSSTQAKIMKLLGGRNGGGVRIKHVERKPTRKEELLKLSKEELVNKVLGYERSRTRYQRMLRDPDYKRKIDESMAKARAELSKTRSSNE